jgi:phosphomannomutase
VTPIKNAGLKIVVDNMWGNGAGWLSEILAGGSTEVIEVHAERNPIFPEMSRPEPIPPNVDAGLAVARASAPTASASWTATPTAAALATSTASS